MGSFPLRDSNQTKIIYSLPVTGWKKIQLIIHFTTDASFQATHFITSNSSWHFFFGGGGVGERLNGGGGSVSRKRPLIQYTTKERGYWEQVIRGLEDLSLLNRNALEALKLTRRSDVLCTDCSCIYNITMLLCISHRLCTCSFIY